MRMNEISAFSRAPDPMRSRCRIEEATNKFSSRGKMELIIKKDNSGRERVRIRLGLET